ncbi:hypothetical protein GDO86_002920 [Hymenochirus boettgeri]|uniref:Uncharacterized protein n=1 Tax=Hymenochirus boettgeri TaxID=247094 RepID=A0A8T2JZ32_9PIPI|nr:hypothetical protein GDO86_002920 [Hymenochirus boettgeri]
MFTGILYLNSYSFLRNRNLPPTVSAPVAQREFSHVHLSSPVDHTFHTFTQWIEQMYWAYKENCPFSAILERKTTFHISLRFTCNETF